MGKESKKGKALARVNPEKAHESLDIYSLTRPKLEHHCLYLQQKRKSLEEAIRDLQNMNEDCRIKNEKMANELLLCNKSKNNNAIIAGTTITRMNDEQQTLNVRIQELEAEVRSYAEKEKTD